MSKAVDDAVAALTDRFTTAIGNVGDDVRRIKAALEEAVLNSGDQVALAALAKLEPLADRLDALAAETPEDEVEEPADPVDEGDDELPPVDEGDPEG